MCTVATNMTEDLGTYASTMESNLSGWDGRAKKSFNTSCSKEQEQIQQTAAYAQKLGEFIKKASAEIEKLENDLATRKI